jgi:hypothetical protein
MIPVPTTFQLGGRTWEVLFISEEAMRTRSGADAGDTVLGLCVTWDAQILIVEGLKAETTQATFYHELAHAIFETLGWTKLSKDEGKVDAMGTMLLQYLHTIDY